MPRPRPRWRSPRWRPDRALPRRRGRCGVGRARSLRSGRPGQRLGTASGLPGNFHAPASEIVGDLDHDGRERNSAYLVDQIGEPGRPATGITTEYRPQRFALGIVGALVDEPTGE